MVIFASSGVLIEEDRILLLRKKSGPFRESWGIPDALQKREEIWEVACLRGMKEELDLDCRVEADLGWYDHKNFCRRFGRYHGFLVSVENGVVQCTPDVQYFPLQALPWDVAPNARTYVDAYLRSKRR